jgi:hypothetical protein
MFHLHVVSIMFSFFFNKDLGLHLTRSLICQGKFSFYGVLGTKRGGEGMW